MALQKVFFSPELEYLRRNDGLSVLEIQHALKRTLQW